MPIGKEVLVLIVRVLEPVPPLDSVILLVLRDTVMPDGADVERLTVPENPPRLARLMLACPDVPC